MKRTSISFKLLAPTTALVFTLTGCWQNWDLGDGEDSEFNSGLDSDGDGIPDDVEGTGDSDGDGTPDYLDEDSDGDGIPDAVEGVGDADGDGIPNYLDEDSDGDGIPDSVEAGPDPTNPVDTDGDGIPDYLDDDSDNDGIPDSVEAGDDPTNPVDSDGDGIPDYMDTDSDNDGWPDSVEGTGDIDGDGIPNYLDEDSDGDGIPDSEDDDVDGDGIPNDVEGTGDSDGDGIADLFDTDSDNDGIPDSIEVGDDPNNPVDTDGDGVPDYLDEDSDGDGYPDAWEGADDLDGDGLGNYADTDSDGDGALEQANGTPAGGGDPDVDGDGIPNEVEWGDDPTTPVDSDGDGIPDFFDWDSDGDNIPDSVEGVGDPDGDGIPNYLDDDSDGDGIPDAQEGFEDLDGDGLPNFLDLDSDGDGIPDSEDDDYDGDGISNVDEGSNQQPPLDSDGDGIPDYIDTDSDNDGIPDSTEIDNGTDPTNADTDGDGWTDLQEQVCGSDWLDPLDTCDGFSGQIPGGVTSVVQVVYETQVQMGDIMFILDETGSMQGTLDDVKNNFSAVAAEVDGLIPNVTYGVASFDDYNFGVMGAGPDKPFHHKQSQTSNLGAVQNALDGLYAGGGWDWPESTVEALYQAATGAGYDQNCNGQYDAEDDVLPYISSPNDVFGGSSGDRASSNPGAGSLGGNGFREGAVPILVYTTDATVRNATFPYNEGPKAGTNVLGCTDANPLFLTDAMSDINAKAIGITARTNDAYGAMMDIALATDSWLDLNGNGANDGGSEWMVWPSSTYNIVDQITDGIEQFTNNVTYDLSIEATAPTGTILNITADCGACVEVPAMNTVTYTLTLSPAPGTAATMFSSTVWTIPTTLYGDGSVVLAQWDLIFIVTSPGPGPGTP